MPRSKRVRLDHGRQTPNLLNNSVIAAPRTGGWDAWLGGYGYQHTDTLPQTVTLPPGCSTYNLSFWLHIGTAETDDFAEGTLQVQFLNADGDVLTTLGTYTNLNAAPGYVRVDFNLAAFAGQKLTLQLTCGRPVDQLGHGPHLRHADDRGSELGGW